MIAKHINNNIIIQFETNLWIKHASTNTHTYHIRFLTQLNRKWKHITLLLWHEKLMITKTTNNNIIIQFETNLWIKHVSINAYKYDRYFLLTRLSDIGFRQLQIDLALRVRLETLRSRALSLYTGHVDNDRAIRRDY